MSTTWIEVQIEVAAEVSELVASTLSELTGGVEIRDAQTVFPTAPDRAAIVALCAPEDVEDILHTVDEMLGIARDAGSVVDPVIIRRREAHEEEWRDVWKQFFRATRVGARFVVRPSWDPGEAPEGEHIIDLDPGRAFGTGAHPSTRLVIRNAEQIADGGAQVMRFLDLGSGSGILSIVATRLWPAARGWAIDTDPEATECALENLERNRVTTVEARTGSLDDVEGRFELVMANIQADVLETLATALPPRLVPGGSLVLSGLLAEQADGVRVVYEATGLRFVGRSDEGEWSALRFSAP